MWKEKKNTQINSIHENGIGFLPRISNKFQSDIRMYIHHINCYIKKNRERYFLLWNIWDEDWLDSLN